LSHCFVVGRFVTRLARAGDLEPVSQPGEFLPPAPLRLAEVHFAELIQFRQVEVHLMTGDVAVNSNTAARFATRL
jgi:hypothetical protein